MDERKISALVSFCPTYVRTYDEWLNVAFLAHAFLSPADLDRLGVLLERFGFGQVSMKELTEDGKVPQDLSQDEEEEPMDMGPWGK